MVQIKIFKTPACGYCLQQIEILEEPDSTGVTTFDPDENVLDATQNVDEGTSTAFGRSRRRCSLQSRETSSNGSLA